MQALTVEEAYTALGLDCWIIVQALTVEETYMALGLDCWTIVPIRSRKIRLSG